jgi:phosphoglycolate phosphatase
MAKPPAADRVVPYFWKSQSGTLNLTWQIDQMTVPSVPSTKRREHSLLITDLDNTLYDFVSYYEAGLSAIINHLSNQFNLDTEEVICRLREVFKRRGTIEYAFAIEEIEEVQRLGDTQRTQFVRQAVTSFWTSATRKLQPYESVCETLRHLYRHDVAIIAYTDAPIHEAMRRLRHLGCDRYISGIVAQRGLRRGNKRSVLLLKELPGHTRPSRRSSLVWRTSPEEKKPNLLIYEGISTKLGFGRNEITVIGDSVARDLLPALELGFTGVWARYGRRNPNKEGLLKSLVPDVLPEARPAQDVPTAVPTADRFEDVLKYLPVQQVLPFEFSMGGRQWQ